MKPERFAAGNGIFQISNRFKTHKITSERSDSKTKLIVFCQLRMGADLFIVRAKDLHTINELLLQRAQWQGRLCVFRRPCKGVFYMDFPHYGKNSSYRAKARQRLIRPVLGRLCFSFGFIHETNPLERKPVPPALLVVL